MLSEGTSQPLDCKFLSVVVKKNEQDRFDETDPNVVAGAWQLDAADTASKAAMILGLQAGQVLLFEAHETWAVEFALEKSRIIDAIGEHVLDVQHIGSTAIPGVPAKPVLDILVGVGDFDEARTCVASLEKIGYCDRHEHGIPRRHYFVKGDPRTHHLHMVERDGEHWRTIVEFRDFLRGHPRSARAYAEAKRNLARTYSLDKGAYQREKDEIVQRLLQTAASLRADA